MKLFSLLAITGINGLHHHFGIQTGGSSQPQPAVQPPAPVMSNNNNMSSMGYQILSSRNSEKIFTLKISYVSY